MTPFQDSNLSIEKMILDPNNYRFQDAPDFIFADSKRFAEETVQAKAYAKLRDESLLPLKQSIVRNGFLPFERLVVTPYEEGKYLVLDGNRRVAAMQWIRSDAQAGAFVEKDLLESFKAIPVVIVPSDSSDPGLLEALMGIRHVSGIRAWGGYQRALLVSTLKENHLLESSDVAQRLGMSVHEVNRRYRALKALQQMMNDENYSDYARPEMYPLFHEAVSVPAVRDWLGWDDTKHVFTNANSREQFYDLLSIPRGQGDESRQPKLTTYSEVRELRDILANNEAKKILLDPSRSFTEALAVTKRQEIVNSWKAEVAEATEAIKGIASFELTNISEDNLQLLKQLHEAVTKALAVAEALKNI